MIACHAVPGPSIGNTLLRWICLPLSCLLLHPAAFARSAAPRVLVPGFRLEEFAAAPQIVTPIALACTADGRLLAIESHTHQRPDNYQGPAFDRIQWLHDADGDGRADQVRTFYEGTRQTMSLLAGPSDWIYVATRREILRLRDRDGDGQADQQESLVRLATRGDYPHNGLAGMTLAPDGRLVFGLGENLGESYELIGGDGSQVSGGGEGGSVFVCQANGRKLERLATGFWNPFGNVFDSRGRLFTVDNDPDASPPCRLLHVVPGGDYGYQFRYGRSGRHPLQAWDAELPGTLPMAAGTGEAPCQVVAYRGRLLVTSWGDYRLEAYSLRPMGASCQAQLEVMVQGDASFRPVGLTVSPDGTLYFSDWVDRSYPVHGQGRIWRLIPVGEESATSDFPPLSAAERRAAELRVAPQFDALSDSDPFVRQAASYGLVQSGRVDGVKFAQITDPQQRLGVLQAVRWQNSRPPEPMLRGALQDPDDDTRIYAMRIVAETRQTGLRADVLALLDETPPISDRLARVTLATLEWLDDGDKSKDNGALFARFAAILESPESRPGLRVLALRSLPADHPAVHVDRLRELLLGSTQNESGRQLAAEAIALLAARADLAAGRLLADFATQTSQPPELRCDATAALAAHLSTQQAVVEQLSQDPEASIRREANRALRTLPAIGQSAAEQALATGEIPQGDAAAGRRAFFRANGARCSVCHAVRGQGGTIGPDLTMIHRRGDPAWLAAAVLNPSRDIAPRYTTVAIVLQDGRTLSGLPLAGPGDDGQMSLVQSDGTQVAIPLTQIAQQTQLGTSVMPTGLAETLSAEELWDLLAFLRNGE